MFRMSRAPSCFYESTSEVIMDPRHTRKAVTVFQQLVFRDSEKTHQRQRQSFSFPFLTTPQATCAHNSWVLSLSLISSIHLLPSPPPTSSTIMSNPSEKMEEGAPAEAMAVTGLEPASSNPGAAPATAASGQGLPMHLQEKQGSKCCEFRRKN
jgi:hypothetical protein